VHFEEHARCRHESLLDALARLRRSLKEAVEALLACKLLSLARSDLSLRLLVLLVRNEEDQCIRVSLIFDFSEPARQMHV
jgi:hypothetical protein